MTTITETMARDHRHCDEFFAEAEELISQGDWEQGRAKFNEFRDATENHFSMEEGILFPKFEQRTGQTMGPTQMMRMEHTQMRQLLADMEAAVTHEDDERYLGLSETMMMVMQQHNMKEEQMLYPMTDQVFAGDAEATLQEMKML
ncbi:hemerythrin domain-containing protein [Sedimenticola selenatireducens]|uniref:Hemerythrin domain-containing protein n=1 Tax=Sedimenticola selenatireducens TaxID=191960 RepID=A0A557RTT0_9GAMM|nr:hemerythrin domain-containing protein [Sedimenticola selenatireducens]TVO68544.1 hemerythrin domain-containing protein [Sedimenticola selenatireducens]TVT66540.1 MAG: hemerythrin domain-containing protein [Sedimenticola selenatireducens]